MKQKTLCVLALILAWLSAAAGAFAQEDLPNRILRGEDVSISCSLRFDRDLPEAAQTQNRVVTLTAPMDEAGGAQARVEFHFALADGALSDGEAAALSASLGVLLSDCAPSFGESDARALANAIAAAFEDRRVRALAADGEQPIYARGDVTLTRLNVYAPYIPALSRGDQGSQVERLQARLITLGYLTGEADGQYGKQTADAVQEAQQSLRNLQSRLMAAAGQGLGQELGDPLSPTIAADGQADEKTLLLLYSDLFPLTDALLEGSPAADVKRLQRRLIALGCLSGKADGDYGVNTRRGVTIFQYYNGLAETGNADADTLRVLYSDHVVAPDYAILSEGSSGTAVKNLQRRLRQGGFYSGAVDGNYGASTVTGVKNLQTWLRDVETEALRQAAQSERLAEQGIAPAQPDDLPEADAAGFEDPAPTAVSAKTQITGVADPMLLEAFYAGDFPLVPRNSMKNGSAGRDVVRLQRRLQTLEYMASSPDGDYGDGTEKAIRRFQARMGLAADGEAGPQTLSALFSLDAKVALKPYLLRVSTAKQRVYAYAPDDNEQYTILVREMKCSTGRNQTPTPKGTYKNGTGPGARWHYFKKFGCWAQYAYTISGDILFHSVLYGSKGGPVTSSSVRNLGRKASHGCVRLSVEDAKWVWTNCPRNTTVIIE